MSYVLCILQYKKIVVKFGELFLLIWNEEIFAIHHAHSLGLMILWHNKLNVVGFIRTFLLRRTHKCKRVARRAGCIFSIGDGSARRKTGECKGLFGRVVENCDGGEGKSEKAKHVVQPISKTVACHISSHRTGI